MNKYIDNEYKKYKIMFLVKQIHDNIISIGKILKEIKSTQIKNKVYDSFIVNMICKIDNYFNTREISIFEWHENILNLKKNFENEFIMIMYERINDTYLHNTDLRIRYKKESMTHLKTFFDFFIELHKYLIEDFLSDHIINNKKI